eukprot:6199856-Pleurochrysis_carterae.AAC.5
MAGQQPGWGSTKRSVSQKRGSDRNEAPTRRWDSNECSIPFDKKNMQQFVSQYSLVYGISADLAATSRLSAAFWVDI